MWTLTCAAAAAGINRSTRCGDSSVARDACSSSSSSSSGCCGCGGGGGAGDTDSSDTYTGGASSPVNGDAVGTLHAKGLAPLGSYLVIRPSKWRGVARPRLCEWCRLKEGGVAPVHGGTSSHHLGNIVPVTPAAMPPRPRRPRPTGRRSRGERRKRRRRRRHGRRRRLAITTAALAAALRLAFVPTPHHHTLSLRR